MQVNSIRLFSKKLMFILASSLLSISALATDLYVSTSGSDSNAGSISAPFRTIQHAANLAKAGTVVHVAPGLYSETISTGASGTSSAHIRYVSSSRWQARIVGSGTEAMWTNNGNYVDIVGFDISGSGRIGILDWGSYTLMAYNIVHNLTISGGCTGNGGAGIENANYTASDDDIIGNVVHNIGTPGACNGVQGIYHSNLRGHIYNNIVYGVSAFGIHLWHAAQNVVVMNNTVFANGSSGMGGGIVIGSGDSPGGIVIDNTTVANNIVYGNPNGGISEYCYSGVNCIGAHNSFTNNLVYANGKFGISLRVGSAANTIAADPLFVNYIANGTGDYHLRSNSPAIDKGSSLHAPTTDLDNNARPQGAGYDIGAYESLVVPPTPTPTPTPPPPAPVISLSVTSLSFGTVKVGSSSVVKFVDIKNIGNAPLNFSGSTLSGDFAYGNLGTCSSSLAVGANCSYSVKFTPKVTGARTGKLVITTNAPVNNPINISLSGSGY